MVNLEWFRTFKTVYEKGTLTSASESLFISQPAVSQQLSALESYVGFKLFDRVARRVVPTERGKMLYGSVKESIERLEEAERRYKRGGLDSITTLSVGMCQETFQYALERAIPNLGFNLVSSFDEYESLLEKLERGVVDVVVTPKKAESRGIVNIPFGREKIVVVSSPGPLCDSLKTVIQKGSTREIEEAFSHSIWYGVSSDNDHFLRFWNIQFGSTPKFRANFIVPNFLSVVRCLVNGNGVAVVPDFLCKDEVSNGDIEIIWSGFEEISNTLYLSYRKGTLFQNEVDVVLEVFRSAYSGTLV